MASRLPLAAVVLCAAVTSASRGDASPHFQNCLHDCSRSNCTAGSLPRHPALVPAQSTLLYRSCEDECKYECMWRTVSAFQRRGMPVPQFYGKWPFTRILGMDEPASVLFSLFNLLGHARGLWLLWQLPHQAPLCGVWRVYSVVCLNAWLWSGVFHARDLPFTERLDYYCAFSMVLGSLYVLCLRAMGPGRAHVKQSLTAGAAAFFAYHVWYLQARRFDYAYNMRVSITIGLLNAAGWLVWARGRLARPYVRACVVVVVGGVAALALELWDFPPLFWLLDAHSLWHLSTAPLAWPWYRFITEDCKYMLKARYWH